MTKAFKPLTKPGKERTYPFENKWFVLVKEDFNLALVSNFTSSYPRLNAIDLFNNINNANLYFDSKLDAYCAIQSYYIYHGEKFPYSKDMESLQACAMVLIESQVMTF